MGFIEQYDESGALYYYNVVTGKTQWAAAEDYVQHYDDQGNAYYVNNITGQSTWQLPAGLPTAAEASNSTSAADAISSAKALLGLDADEPEKEAVAEMVEWVDVWDPAAAAYYYYNNFTGECVWEKPDTFIKLDLDKIKRMMAPELRAALRMQCAYRSNAARRKTRMERGHRRATVITEERKSQGLKEMTWSEIIDPASGAPYYYNLETSEMTWNKPTDFDAMLKSTELVSASDAPPAAEAEEEIEDNVEEEVMEPPPEADVELDDKPAREVNEEDFPATDPSLAIAASHIFDNMTTIAGDDVGTESKEEQIENKVKEEEVKMDDTDKAIHEELPLEVSEVEAVKAAEEEADEVEDIGGAIEKLLASDPAEVEEGEIPETVDAASTSLSVDVDVDVDVPASNKAEERSPSPLTSPVARGMQQLMNEIDEDVDENIERETEDISPLNSNYSSPRFLNSRPAIRRINSDMHVLQVIENEQKQSKKQQELEQILARKTLQEVDLVRQLRRQRQADQEKQRELRIAQKAKTVESLRTLKAKAAEDYLQRMSSKAKILNADTDLDKRQQRKQTEAAIKRAEQMREWKKAYAKGLAARGARAAHAKGFHSKLTQNIERFQAAKQESSRLARLSLEATYTSVWDAVGNQCSLDTLRLLLQQAEAEGLDVNAHDVNGDTLLHQACFNNQVTSVVALLECPRLRRNQVDNSSRKATPLHEAASCGSLAIAELLLQQVDAAELPAFLHRQDYYGDTPLHVACREQHWRLVQFLLEQDAALGHRSFHMTNNKGCTPFDLARGKKTSVMMKRTMSRLSAAIRSASGQAD